jgi:hypothetical protein
MANVRAYFQVAYKVQNFICHPSSTYPFTPQRVIDYVPLAIEHELNQTLAKKLQQSLFQSLLKVPDAAERMKELLDEDPDIASQRKFLESRKARLIEIKERLENFRLVSVG